MYIVALFFVMRMTFGYKIVYFRLQYIHTTQFCNHAIIHNSLLNIPIQNKVQLSY